MKKYFFCLLIIVLSFNSNLLSAQGENKFTSQISIKAEEKFIGLLSSRILSKKPILWKELELHVSNGWFGSVKNGNNIGQTNQGERIFLTGGWKNDWLSLSTTLVNQKPIKEIDSPDKWYPNLGLKNSTNLGTHEVTGEIQTCWLSELDDFSSGALVLLPSILHNYKKPFGINCLSFSQKIYLNWIDNFGPNSSSGVFVRWSPQLLWCFEQNSRLAIGYTLVAPLVDPDDGRRSEGSFFLKFKFLF